MRKNISVYRFRTRFSGDIANIVASEYEEAVIKAEIWFESICGISPNVSRLIDKVNQIPIYINLMG